MGSIVHDGSYQDVPCWTCVLRSRLSGKLPSKSTSLPQTWMSCSRGSSHLSNSSLQLSPPKPIGQTSSPTNTEAPSTGRSGPGPGGSVGRPVTPPPPASTGPTDTLPGRYGRMSNGLNDHLLDKFIIHILH